MQGLILLNKPTGLTSFSAVSRIKRLAHEKRVGHTGTLDPLATGVLPILLGRATALAGIALDKDKRYTAEIKLGITTDTDDISGKQLSEKSVNVTEAELDNALSLFKGKLMQRPPIYSALKKDGVRLYDLARAGKTVEIAEREIEIYSLTRLTDITEDNTFKIDVHVSKGTYIRSLARDIGAALGCGGTLTALCRTYTGGIELTNCVSLEELTEENIENYIISEEKIVEQLTEIKVTPPQAIRFCNGGQLSFERLKHNFTQNGELFRVKSGDKLLGIGYADLEKQELAIKCVIRNCNSE